MVTIPQIISESDFAAICTAIPLKGGIDKNTLREELIRVALDYRDRRNQLQNGFSPKEVRDIALKVGKFVRAQQTIIIDQYTIKTDDEEIGDIEWIPEWLAPLLEGLEATSNAANQLKPDPNAVRTGRIGGVAFTRLIDDLIDLFEKYTEDHRVTAYTTKDKDGAGKQQVSAFQAFARSSSVAFAVDEVTDTFEKKVANALSLRRQNELRNLKR